ncbi:two-component system, LytTR family, sensor histidine kinase AlgZ [Burkholderiales bacterium]|nr:two-component system, LytTR family, sensor histidine kinase AlgZ [Burkholderiales bacterium]
MVNPAAPSTTLAALARGFRASWLTFALIAAINTGIAGIMWIDDPRPFWHPLVTVQIYGFTIAYCVNVASPWEGERALRRLVVAVAIGSVAGILLVILAKGYTWEYVVARRSNFAYNVVLAFFNGFVVSLFFYLKLAAARAQAKLARAEAERLLLSKQAVEAELKLMQAQVEPHFLFNTLASVQFLTETDPPGAHRLLGHLIAYLRAALPQLRAESTTLGKELELCEAYLSILRTRIGPRLAFAVDAPDELRAQPFPPNLLVSLVENAVKHGIEPSADGGTISVQARRDGDRLVVEVIDTGRGMVAAGAGPGGGVGLANVRERLAALYGARGRFTLSPVEPRGTRAALEIPIDDAA